MSFCRMYSSSGHLYSYPTVEPGQPACTRRLTLRCAPARLARTANPTLTLLPLGLPAHSSAQGSQNAPAGSLPGPWVIYLTPGVIPAAGRSRGRSS